MDMELEEGEACSFPNDNTTDHVDYDANMDPDIALSYIDKKVEHVLGHFQKDFEGAASVEDLGSKFGAYGSFLPTYQRSPAWSHLAPKNNHYAETISPNNLQPESGSCSSITSLTAPQSIKLDHGTASAASLPALKISSSVTGSDKQEKCMSSKSFANEIVPEREPINKTSANLSNNKLLKVRIKVGLDNPSTQNNAAIYSGLGLDVSPSSTVEESPSGSGIPHESQDSPEQIFQIMLSFPLDGSLLLSPLLDDVLKLTEEGRRSEERGRLVVPRVGPEMSATVSNDSYMKSSENVSREKKIRSLKSNESKAELKSEKWKDYDALADVSPKNQIAENSAFENTTKATSGALKEAFKCVGRDKIGKPIQEDIMIESGKFASTKVQEDSGASYVRKDEHRKVEKPYGSTKKVSNTSNGGEDLCSELTDSLKHKAIQRGTFDELEDTNLYSGKRHLSSEDRSKLKGSYNHSGVAAEVSNSPMAEGKKNTRSDDYRSKVSVDSCKSQKNNEKASDKYKDFFGEIDVEEEEESQMSPFEMHYDNKAKDTIVAQKKTNSTITVKEQSAGSKNDKLLTSEVQPMSSSAVPSTGNGAISDAAFVPAAGLANDLWVCCDECQIWRLLPPWINHAELPDNWQCKMMSWIPGMNHCGISEEETTKAVMASSQVPPVKGHSVLQNNYHGAFDLSTFSTQQSDRERQNLGSHGVSTLGKRKHSSKDSSNSSYAGPSWSSSSMKKTIRSSVTNGILNDVNHPSVSNEFDSSRDASGDLPVKEHKYKKREKTKSSENFSEGGKMKHPKGKGNRQTDQDSLRAAKNIKSEGLMEDLWTDKVDPRSSNNLGNQKMPKYDGNTSNGTKHNRKEQIHLSKRKEGQIFQDNGSLDVVECADGDGVKKRKAKAIHDTGNYFHEIGKDDDKKGKKAKLSMSNERPSVSTSNEKTSGGTETKGRQRRSGRPGQNPRNIHQSLDGVDLLRRGSGSLRSYMVATSSSSKVSNSHKTKTNLQDSKGSPVESVSSSPTRASRQEKFPTRGGNLADKDGGSIVCPESGTSREQKTPDADSDNHGSLEATKDCNHVSVVKARSITEPSPNRINCQSTDDVADDMVVHHAQRHNKLFTSNQLLSDEMGNNDDHVTGSSKSQTSGKGFPLRSKDNNRIASSEFDKDTVEVSESIDRQVPSTVKPVSCKSTIEEKFAVNSDESVNKFVNFKDSGRLLSKDASNRVIQSRGTSSTDVKEDAKTKTVASEEKLKSLPPSFENQNAVARGSQVVASGKGNRSDTASADVSNGDDASKVLKEARRVDHSNGTHHSTSINLLPNGHLVNNGDDVRSPVKIDPSSQAANNALKEATNLKHFADRVKNTGSDQEGARLHFEAALQFLHGASLFETCSSENARTGELSQAMQIYSSTAKFCEFCAHEYEKCKDMAAVALAYKCAEVAYMRVIYSSSTSANRDRHQLQQSLQMIPPVESPSSSSASDIDNMNHPTSGDKARLGRGVSSPHVTGSHVIAAQNRPSFVRILDFVQDVNAAIEASRKSRAAFTAASVNSEEKFKEGLTSVKTALDFGFQDIEEMLRLMKLAFDAITR